MLPQSAITQLEKIKAQIDQLLRDLDTPISPQEIDKAIATKLKPGPDFHTVEETLHILGIGLNKARLLGRAMQRAGYKSEPKRRGKEVMKGYYVAANI